MPRCVRNFWVELDVDGRSRPVSGGPKNSGGGFQVTVWMRNRGEVMKAMVLEGKVTKEGKLLLMADDVRRGVSAVETVTAIETER